MNSTTHDDNATTWRDLAGRLTDDERAAVYGLRGRGGAGRRELGWRLGEEPSA